MGVGGYLGHKGGPGNVVNVISRGISTLPFQKKYGVCLYKCPTVVMINRCGNETGKVSFCIFNVNKSFFVIFILLDTDNDVKRIAYACLVYQYTMCSFFVLTFPTNNGQCNCQ